jgi:hypothetical protein
LIRKSCLLKRKTVSKNITGLIFKINLNLKKFVCQNTRPHQF